MNKVVLSDIIEIISGGTPKTSEPMFWINGDIGWLSINDFSGVPRKVYRSEKKITQLGVENSSTNILDIDDIIISARGTVGELAQIGFPMAFNQSCFGIRGKKDIINNNYLFYNLKNYVNNIVKRSQGSVFNTINRASFDLMEINIHTSISIQKKIANVLSSIDDKIELNNKINDNLSYYFIQLLPARSSALVKASREVGKVVGFV